jgi:hypothetical protein
MPAKYETHTTHNLGWGNGSATFSSPSMYTGDIGVTVQWGADGRQMKPASQWPQGTTISIAVRTDSSGGPGNTNHTVCYVLNPPTGVSTIQWDGGEYQSFMSALRLSGVLKSAPVYTNWYFGSGQGGGGYWGDEITSGIVPPAYVAVGTYGVNSIVDPRVDSGAASGLTERQQNTDRRGYCFATLHESTDASPLIAFDRGNDSGTYDNAGAVAAWNGIIGGAQGIILLGMKRFMDDLRKGLIPPWKLRRAWDQYLGNLPPIGTPVMEWITADSQGKIVGRGQSDLRIGRTGYYYEKEKEDVKSIQHNGNARAGRSGNSVYRRNNERSPLRSPLLTY